MMGRVAMGSRRRRRLPWIPRWRWITYFVPQGISADIIATEYGFTRDDARRAGGRIPENAPQSRLGETTGSAKSVITVQGPERADPDPDRNDEYMRPRHRHAEPWRAEPVLPDDGRADAGLRQGSDAEIPASGEDQPRPPRGQQLGHRGWGRGRTDRQQGVRARNTA